MKLLLTLAVILTFCGLISMAEDYDEMTSEFKAGFNECMEENGVTQEYMKDMKNGKIKPEDATQNFKCAIKCAMEKRGSINAETGEPVPEVIKSHLSNSMPEDKLDKCANIKAEDPCETAFQVAHCLYTGFKEENNDEA